MPSSFISYHFFVFCDQKNLKYLSSISFIIVVALSKFLIYNFNTFVLYLCTQITLFKEPFLLPAVVACLYCRHEQNPFNGKHEREPCSFSTSNQNRNNTKPLITYTSIHNHIHLKCNTIILSLSIIFILNCT